MGRPPADDAAAGGGVFTRESMVEMALHIVVTHPLKWPKDRNAYYIYTYVYMHMYICVNIIQELAQQLHAVQ